MDDIEITNVKILPTNELSVTPVSDSNDNFQFIYRAATGVTWNDDEQCFMSPAPKEWSYFDWYKNIIATVFSEMGINLIITPQTKWEDIPAGLQREIKEYNYHSGA